MIRQFFNKSQFKSPEGFKYRGLIASRLENLTDAVFAFSITLLIISSEVPKDFMQLKASMYGFIGFICCTIMLLGIWNVHKRFFLYYGLTDRTTQILNFFFLFVLLFYIYPLKFLFSYVGTQFYISIKHAMGDVDPALKIAAAQINQAQLSLADWRELMVQFGLGLMSIFIIVLLWHIHALRKRKMLQLNKREVFITRTNIYHFTYEASISLVYILATAFLPAPFFLYSAVLFISIAFFKPIFSRKRMAYFEKKLKEKKAIKKARKAQLKEQALLAQLHLEEE